MPTYDYICESNGRVVEVNHRMSDEISNWGELCQLAGIEPGETPATASVARLANGGSVISSTSSSPDIPACATGGCCAGGACGI
jgi:hypothetical protein